MSYRQTRQELETEIEAGIIAALGEWAASPEAGEIREGPWRAYRCNGGSIILRAFDEATLTGWYGLETWGQHVTSFGTASPFAGLIMRDLASLRHALPALARQAGEIMGRAEQIGQEALAK